VGVSVRICPEWVAGMVLNTRQGGKDSNRTSYPAQLTNFIIALTGIAIWAEGALDYDPFQAT